MRGVGHRLGHLGTAGPDVWIVTAFVSGSRRIVIVSFFVPLFFLAGSSKVLVVVLKFLEFLAIILGSLASLGGISVSVKVSFKVFFVLTGLKLRRLAGRPTPGKRSS